MASVRKGMPDPTLGKSAFIERVKARFYDPAFAPETDSIARLAEIAWADYQENHKSPRRTPAGPGFADPDYELPVEWLETRAAIAAAEQRRRDPNGPARVLLINGSPRSEHTCPGEMSKTWRLVQQAQEVLTGHGIETALLDLSRLCSEYGRVIYPCKACVSTAMPLCHWPCSCYPNHGFGQVNDWMAEIYPMWAAAHGIMIVAPVHWYQAPSVLKLMIDRLVCADGGNPDPTTTKIKDPELAKALELKGWDYPRHLAGRLFAVVTHGDAEGADPVRDHIARWLTDMGLIAAGNHAGLARYVGYYGTYAESHEALDRDQAFFAEVRNAARSLAEAVTLQRQGALPQPDAGLREPRPK